jgi:hypothetical protein
LAGAITRRSGGRLDVGLGQPFADPEAGAFPDHEGQVDALGLVEGAVESLLMLHGMRLKLVKRPGSGWPMTELAQAQQLRDQLSMTRDPARSAVGRRPVPDQHHDSTVDYLASSFDASDELRCFHKEHVRVAEIQRWQLHDDPDAFGASPRSRRSEARDTPRRTASSRRPRPHPERALFR